MNGRLRKEYVKAVKAEKQLAAKLAPDQLADVYAKVARRGMMQNPSVLFPKGKPFDAKECGESGFKSP